MCSIPLPGFAAAWDWERNDEAGEDQARDGIPFSLFGDFPSADSQEALGAAGEFHVVRHEDERGSVGGI